jgi:hypothetical protein
VANIFMIVEPLAGQRLGFGHFIVITG